jgi:hypothetical protein
MGAAGSKVLFRGESSKTLRKMGHDSCLQNALLTVF